MCSSIFKLLSQCLDFDLDGSKFMILIFYPYPPFYQWCEKWYLWEERHGYLMDLKFDLSEATTWSNSWI